jgi:hypothetical protein
MQEAISDRADTTDGEEFDRDLKSGMLDKMLELAGYDDDEDPDEADARRQAVVAKVAAHLLLDAVDQGLMKPRDALEHLVEYIALPDGHEDDPHAAAAELWRDIHAGKRLRLADVMRESRATSSQKKEVEDYISRYDRKRSRR